MNSSLDQIAEDYVAFLQRGQGLCRSTVQGHRRYVMALLADLRRQGLSRWADLSPGHLDRFTSRFLPKFRRPYRAVVVCVLRRFVRYLHFRGLIERPLEGMLFAPRIYRHERLPRFLTPEEIRRLLESIDRSRPAGRRDYAILLVLVSSGLRVGELLKLTLDDVDWRARLLRVRATKTRSNRVVPLPAPAFEVLVDYVRRDRAALSNPRALFLAFGPRGRTRRDPRPLAYNTLNRRVHRYLAKAKLRLRSPCHGLRHSYAQHLLEEGAGYPALQALLGHESLHTVGFYARVHFAQLREVADNYAENL